MSSQLPFPYWRSRALYSASYFVRPRLAKTQDRTEKRKMRPNAACPLDTPSIGPASDQSTRYLRKLGSLVASSLPQKDGALSRNGDNEILVKLMMAQKPILP